MQLLLALCSQALQENDPQKLILLANRINARAGLINDRIATVISTVQQVEEHVENVVVHCPTSERGQ